jgi:ribonuclease G
MQKEILINVESQEKRVAVVEGGVLQEYYVERPSETTMVGNIYKGVVRQVVPGIGAAFVDIGYEKNGFLYLTDMLSSIHESDLFEDEGEIDIRARQRKRIRPQDITKYVKSGQDIIVQVVKEPIGTKGPRLTTHVAIPGRIVVLVPNEQHIGISKKVSSKDERARLYKLLKRVNAAYKTGLIVRTAGEGRSERDFRREIKYLNALWSKIMRDAGRARPPALLHEERELTFRILRDMYSEDITRILIDDREEYRKLRHFANLIAPEMKRKLLLYKERRPLFESRGIEKEIERLYGKRVPLRCGGYIFIEETEGLVAIDVNSGSFSRGKIEDTALKVNREAAEEIARQIRLRDIGGIIIIDFIDMEDRRHKNEIFGTLIRAVKRDRAKIKILRMSEFGVVEMTRQRIRRGVRSVSYQDCPYCKGRGSVKSPTTMAISVLRAVKKELESGRKKQVSAYVHPDVANYLLNEDRPSISRIEREHRTRVVIIADPEMHIEDYRIQ